MGKTALAIVMLIVGLLAGIVAGGSLIGGTMAGAGAGAGLSLGICSTTQAATELGYLDEAQVDEVLNRAAQDISGKPAAEGQQIVGSASACADVMAQAGEGA